jgi:hypothetical protein
VGNSPEGAEAYCPAIVSFASTLSGLVFIVKSTLGYLHIAL